jgi:acyl-CoA thioester hydrolase
VTVNGVHRFPVRVYYEDTDFSGYVYHANYLKFLERARTELIRELGMDQRAMFDAGGGTTHFVVSAMRIQWKRPALMDDLLTVETRLGALRGASVTLEQQVLRDGEVLLAASVDIAHLAAGRPVRMADWMHEAYEKAAGL